VFSSCRQTDNESVEVRLKGCKVLKIFGLMENAVLNQSSTVISKLLFSFALNRFS